MDKALCQPSEQIGGRPRFNLSTSLKPAIAALPAPRATPLFGPSLIDRLIDAFDAAPVEPLAAVPGRGGRRGKPVLFGHALFPAVRMLEGDKGARDLVAAAQENILELTAGERAMEIDIDTREDPRLLHGIRST